MPLDDSPASVAALDQAVELAESTHATLVLLNVITTARPLVAGPMGTFAFVVEEASGLDHQRSRKLIAAAGDRIPDEIPWEHLTTSGSPAREIARLLESGNYDMVVVGSRGLGTIGAALGNSVSSGVARHTKAPVMLVQANGEKSFLDQHPVEPALRETA